MLATLTFPAVGEPRPLQREETVCVRSADDLRRALRAARERRLVLDTSALNRMLRLDGERNRLELQAATPWRAVAGYLGEHGAVLDAGLRVAVFPDSVGEAVSANAAGPDGTPMVSHVEAITLVTPDGELRRVDREGNLNLFRLAVGGHGLFGVLYSVTLRVDSLLRSAQRAQAPVELDLTGAGVVGGVYRSAEVLVPPEELDRVFTDFRDLAAERRITLQKVLVRKLRPENETFLRWASREWAGLTIVFCTRATLGASVQAAEIHRLLLETALSHGGSFPIGEAPIASLAQLDACYPGVRAFVAEKRRYDPAERMQNRWYRRVAALLRGESRRSSENE